MQILNTTTQKSWKGDIEVNIDKHYALDRKLFEAASVMDAPDGAISAWLFNLIDQLIAAGFNARIIQKMNNKVFMVDDKISEDLGLISDVTMQRLLGSLDKLGITVELYPEFALIVTSKMTV